MVSHTIVAAFYMYAGLAAGALLILGFSQSALALVCKEYSGPWNKKDALPYNTCVGTLPQKCAYVYPSADSGVRAKVDGAFQPSTQAWIWHNNKIYNPGAGASWTPAITTTGSGTVTAKTYGDWYGYITAQAPGGQAILWQGGNLWRDGVYIHLFGTVVAQGEGPKSGVNRMISFSISTSGTHTYKVGSNYEAEVWTTLIPGLNHVDFLSGAYNTNTNKVRLESTSTGSPVC